MIMQRDSQKADAILSFQCTTVRVALNNTQTLGVYLLFDKEGMQKPFSNVTVYSPHCPEQMLLSGLSATFLRKKVIDL